MRSENPLKLWRNRLSYKYLQSQHIKTPNLQQGRRIKPIVFQILNMFLKRHFGLISWQ
jgi:hypothetical protein